MRTNLDLFLGWKWICF